MFLPIFGQLSVNFGENSWEIGHEMCRKVKKIFFLNKLTCKLREICIDSYLTCW